MLINRLTVEKIVFYPYKGTLPRNKSGHSNDMHHRRISVFMLKFMLFFLKKKKKKVLEAKQKREFYT